MNVMYVLAVRDNLLSLHKTWTLSIARDGHDLWERLTGSPDDRGSPDHGERVVVGRGTPDDCRTPHDGVTVRDCVVAPNGIRTPDYGVIPDRTRRWNNRRCLSSVVVGGYW